MHSYNFIKIPEKLSDPIKALTLPKRCLLAMSGGSDSTALFYTLVSLQKEIGFELAVAHVDHQWRQESGEEAKQLEEKVQVLGIPYYQTAINPKSLKGNLENLSREARYAFFEKLCAQEKFDALILAHHKDDLAETVLKRIFEGSALQRMGTMQPVSKRNQLTLLRPWLHVNKADILDFLHTNQIPYFVDPTNHDGRFLRGNMRTNIIPQLEQQFNKSITEPLYRLSQECHDLAAWMETKWYELLQAKYLDCALIPTPFERKWVIRAWLSRQDIPSSYSIIQTLVDLVENNSADCAVETGVYRIEIDRKKLFVRPKRIFTSEPIQLKLGESQWGPWKMVVKEELTEEVGGWKAILEGQMITTIDSLDLTLGLYHDIVDPLEKKKWQKRWNEAKIPAFFRSFVPVIASEGRLKHEFLLINHERQKKDGKWSLILLYDESLLC